MLRPTCFVLGSLVMLCSVIGTAGVVRAGQTVVVVLDDSGSMDRRMASRQRRIDAAKEALTTVLLGLPHDTNVGVLALNSRLNGMPWIVPIGSPDPARWGQSIGAISARGGTPLGQMMRDAADELLKQRAAQPYDIFRMLVVTDGEATDAPLLNSILPDLLSRGIRVDVIGVDMKEEHSLARLAHSYRRAGDRASLEKALSEVMAETTLDDQAMQSDFELIAGLSEETASAIVKGLTSPDNDPLQEMGPGQGMAIDPATGQAIGQNPGQGVPPNVAPAAPSPSGQSVVATGTSAIMSMLCCCGTIMFLSVVILSIILNAVKNHTRS